MNFSGDFQEDGLSQEQRIDQDDVSYYLYTNNSGENYIYLNEDNLDSLNNSNKVIFFIHGWKDSRTASLWYQPLRKILLEKEDVSVIEVDYERIANLFYPVAAALANKVGKL